MAVLTIFFFVMIQYFIVLLLIVSLIYYALSVFNVIIEFDNWTTLTTLCNIGQSTLRDIARSW